jgi:type IV pilus assembly protein PilA
MQSKRSSAAFTLIELMISVAIIGILAAGAITLFQHQQFRAKRAEGMTNVEAIVKMVRAYFGEAGRYPWTAGSWPAGAPTPAVTQWDPASSAAFGVIGFRAEQAIRFRYDVDAGPECPCASGACFTVTGYSNLDGDPGIAAVAYYHRDAALVECPSMLGWLAPIDPRTALPIYDSVAAFPLGGGGVPGADDY